MTDALKIYMVQNLKISPDEMTTILACFKHITVAKNDILLHQGEVCRYTYFVVNGSMRAFFIDDDGQEATRYIAFEQNFITTLNSFITQTPANEFLQATEKGDVLAISHTDFRILLSKIPAWKDLYIKQLEIAYTTNAWRLESFIKMDAKQRYDFLLKTNPQAIQRLSNKIIANYLGITQESLSRLKGKK